MFSPDWSHLESAIKGRYFATFWPAHSRLVFHRPKSSLGLMVYRSRDLLLFTTKLRAIYLSAKTPDDDLLNPANLYC